MPLYDFPLWATDSARFPKEGISGAGWKLVPIEVRNFRHGTRSWERRFSEMRKKYPYYADNSLLNGDGKIWIAPQIVAEASSRSGAQKAFQLLMTAITIIDGSNTFDFENALVVPRNRGKLEDLTKEEVDVASYHTLARGNIVLGSKFAAALSRSKSLSYAVFKLTLSYKMASTHWMNHHPRYYPKQFSVTKSLGDQVRMASAITLAYSAIEEMQFQPKPIDGKPVKDRGVWDPAALADLQNRLQKGRIDLGSPLSWIIRGTNTRIHNSARAPKGSKQSWAKGVVRDQAVKIEDALVAASWLRSKCSTHKYTRETQSISMYDVANVQILTRRLLLESTGLWKDLLQPPG